MCRGVARSPIFLDDSDRQEFLRQAGAVLEDASAKCYAWALLPNHVHLLLRTGADTLGHMMQRLLTRYAGYFNRRHARVGHLFQNRFRSILGQEEKYFLALVRYIHLNPVKAGIVDNIEQLRTYPWTGHADLMSTSRFEWMDCDFVLGQFGSIRARAARNYEAFLLEDQQIPDSDHPNIRDPAVLLPDAADNRESMRVLGQGEFVGRVIRRVEGRDRRRRNLQSRLSPEEVLDRAVGALGVTMREVRSNSRRTAVAKARALASKWLVEDLGLQGAKVADLLNVSASVVSRGVKAGRDIEAELGISIVVGG